MSVLSVSGLDVVKHLPLSVRWLAALGEVSAAVEFLNSQPIQIAGGASEVIFGLKCFP